MGCGHPKGQVARPAVEERVARYGTEHKEATRRRIVERAGRRFKRDGIDGSGIATLMADAGLTNGAFYAHFAVQGRPDRQRHERGTTPPGRRPRARSSPVSPGSSSSCAPTCPPAHRDHPDGGLSLGRAARRDRTVRRRNQEGLHRRCGPGRSWTRSPPVSHRRTRRWAKARGPSACSRSDSAPCSCPGPSPTCSSPTRLLGAGGLGNALALLGAERSELTRGRTLGPARRRASRGPSSSAADRPAHSVPAVS